jgi:tetratricopeptide (TPR) repeat protein
MLNKNVFNLCQADSNNINAWINLGKNYYMEKKYQKANEALSKALEIDCDHITVWKKLISLLSMIKKPEGVRKCSQKIEDIKKE